MGRNIFPKKKEKKENDGKDLTKGFISFLEI